MDCALSAEKRALPYDNAREHLADLLTQLDVRIQREYDMHRRHRDRGEPWAGFAAITDEEMNALLTREPENGPAAIGAEQQEKDRRLAEVSCRIDRRVASSIEAGVRLPLVELARIFNLAPLEIHALTACFGPEVDRRYERLYGYLNDDMTRKWPTIGLVLSLGSQEAADVARFRPIFARHAPLLKFRLLQIVEEAPGGYPFMSQAVKMDGRIASFLLGEAGIDYRIQDAVEWTTPGAEPTRSGGAHGSLVEQLASSIESRLGNTSAEKKPVFYLYGPPGTGKQVVVREVCRRLGLPLMAVDAEQLAARAIGFDDGMFLVLRDNLLCQSALHVKNLDRALEQTQDRLRLLSLMQHVRTMGGITFLSGEKPWSWQIAHERILFSPIELKLPEYVEQAALWKAALQGQSELEDDDLLRIVSKYPSSPGQIGDAVALARTQAALRSGGGAITRQDIEHGCRTHNIPDLGRMARKIEPKHVWNDMILPPPQMSQLRDICSHVHYRSVVYGAWGFGRKLSLGKGLNALFFGPPGTGKTMAAEILAAELGLDLYKIDLSQVVSKYIGETEKNLHQIFQEAQACHAILFFDEADALLGKRSEVKDAHDRYANLEIAYLLQKMEEYEGVTILATNLRQNMDEAFTRRIRFMIDFPFPEEDSRLGIWKGIWPKETPMAKTVDLPLLAKKFKLAGGNIRNIAIAAAFSASSNGQCVEMKHLLNATKQEFLKMGRLVDESEYA